MHLFNLSIWNISKFENDLSTLSDSVDLFVDIGCQCSVVCCLDEAQMHTLANNSVHLADCIVADDEFITEIATAGCITWPQKQQLGDLVLLHDRSIALLEFLTNGSVANFSKFISIVSTQQPYLMPLLATNGG